VRIIVIILDNHGFDSIGGLSESLGCERFGTRLRSRGGDGRLSGPNLDIDFAANAASLGAHAIRVSGTEELAPALKKAAQSECTAVIVMETQMEHGVPSYDTWWDVPISEASNLDSIQNARTRYDQQRQAERHFL
jgi:3D-(3,5/4)-trihydroxycyclohexane-1,2-dione acylhydrolase (decyclizing)